MDIAFEAFGFKRITHDGALWYKPHTALQLLPQAPAAEVPDIRPQTAPLAEIRESAIAVKPVTSEISQTDGVDGCYALAYVDDCLVVGTTDEV